MLGLKGLTKTFGNGVQALGGVTLDVAPGEITAIIGGSGCGKSTLLRLISGLERASSGSVTLDSDAVTAPHPLINLIFQEPRLLPWLSVDDNIRFGLSHLDRSEQDRRASAALEQVHLQGYGDRLPKELSGGQAQRVAIARALVTRPKVLLLDEPFSALDALTRATLQNHLLDIWRQTQATIILVTHDIEEAVALAHRVIVMKPWPGRVLDDIAIDLPIPREGLSTEAERYRKRLRTSLAVSMQGAERHALAL